MDYKITGHKPPELFHFFEDLSAVPRGSYREKGISDFLVNFAKERNLECLQDSHWNVIIKKPGSENCGSLPPVILQGHIDMVCEKTAGSSHNFETDGIDLIVDGDKLTADGTTLGADDGAAVAVMMCILDSDEYVHPPLECVFTTSEEVGLLGAKALDYSKLHAKRMINIDSEDENLVTVSCAGGMRLTLHKAIERISKNGFAADVSITGLLGGHSGTDIDKERANANKLMARIISRALKDGADLISFCGGNADNAIPRESRAVLLYKDTPKLEELKALAETIRHENSLSEPAVKVEIGIPAECTADVIPSEDAECLVNAVLLSPNGVIKRRADDSRFIIASVSLGIVNTDDEMRIVFAPRSSVDSLQQHTVELLNIIAETYGFETSVTGEYPGWEWKEDSQLQEVFKICSKKVFGEECKIEAIHAGLECGLFYDAIPGLDAVSVGPSMTGVHTPDETVSLSSFEKTFELIKEVLEFLTKE